MQLNDIITEVTDLALAEGFDMLTMLEFETYMHNNRELPQTIKSLFHDMQFIEITDHVLANHGLPTDTLMKIVNPLK